MSRRNNDDEIGVGGAYVLGLIYGAIILAIVSVIAGVYSPAIDELDINKDNLAYNYVVSYYPEYANCSMKYINDLEPKMQGITPGVEIYCQEDLPNRDSLKRIGISPSYELAFDNGMSINDVFFKYLENEGLRE